MAKNEADDESPTVRMKVGFKGAEARGEAGKEKKRRSSLEARRLTSRGRFIVTEMLKLREVTVEQVSMLLRMKYAKKAPLTKQAAWFVLERLRSLGLLEVQDSYVRLERHLVYQLTKRGHEQAAMAVGVDEYQRFSEQAVPPYLLAHQLMVNELYLRVLSERARSWVETMNNAARFLWVPANEKSAFRWRKPSWTNKKIFRKVIPDVTVETDKVRFLIEVERSTKTLSGVGEKLTNYHELFSKTAIAEGGATAYKAKYKDELRPVVMFVFQSEQRAMNVQKEHERRRRTDPTYAIAEALFGSLEQAVAKLRQELLDAPPPVPKLMADEAFLEELRTYVRAIHNCQQYSSVDWPKNWRTVLARVLSADEAERKIAKYEARLKRALARNAIDERQLPKWQKLPG